MLRPVEDRAWPRVTPISVALILVSGFAYGAAPHNYAFSMSKADCDGEFVDKEKLVADLTEVFKLSRLRLSLMQQNATVLAGASPDRWSARVDSQLFGTDICGSKFVKGNICGEDLDSWEQTNDSLRAAKSRLRALLNQRRGLGRSGTDFESAAFFRAGKASDNLACTVRPGASIATVVPTPTGPITFPPTTVPGVPAASNPQLPSTGGPTSTSEVPPSKSIWSLDHVRVRGFGRQIMDPHADISNSTATDTFHSGSLFDSTNGLQISYKYNGQNSTRTDSVVGTFGYEFNITPVLGKLLAIVPELYLVPYIGMDRELTNKPSTTGEGTVSQFSTNFVDFGISATAFVIAPSTTEGTPLSFAGQLISIRPDYLMNYIDHSRIASMNIRYVPLLNEYMNSYGPAFIEDLQASLLFDIRTNGGLFTDHGHPADRRLNRDYVRIGGRAGGAVSYTLDPSHSLDLVADYTDFAALSGFKKDLGEFEASLVLNLLPNKLFNISVNYRNGRREDTGQRDEAWMAGLSIHY